MKILLIDDDPHFINIMGFILTEKGHSVSTALNGENGLQDARGESWDLILLDISMPGMDGFEICARIRSLPGHKYTQVFFMTALSKLRDIDAAFEVGGTDYVYKNVKDIAEVIERKYIKNFPAVGGPIR